MMQRELSLRCLNKLVVLKRWTEVLPLFSPKDLYSPVCIRTRGRKRGQILNVCYLIRELGVGKICTRHKKIRGKSKHEARAQFPFLTRVTCHCSIHPKAFASPSVRRTRLVWQTLDFPLQFCWPVEESVSAVAAQRCWLESRNGLVRKTELPWVECPMCWSGQVPSS